MITIVQDGKSQNSITSFKYTPGLYNVPEVPKTIALQVKGCIPSWLKGVLYRMGPGMFDVPLDNRPDEYYTVPHWFDSLPQVHRFEITDKGEVLYFNRNIAPELQKKLASEGSNSNYYSFGPDPCRYIYRKDMTVFKERPFMIDGDPRFVNANLSIVPNFPGFPVNDSKTVSNLVATIDSNALEELDPDTLVPLQFTNYDHLDPELNGEFSTGHPAIDPDTNELFNITYKIGKPYSRYQAFGVRNNPEDPT
ncbi:uncharacterized protein VTP21DRAFT_5321 [Calcarisporiella thermophila]|uniref:uncharacterized protein n=1 Tax=Calcarisporiella thermophila TaxID=911321 RepID=UPI0037427CA5